MTPASYADPAPGRRTWGAAGLCLRHHETQDWSPLEVKLPSSQVYAGRSRGEPGDPLLPSTHNFPVFHLGLAERRADLDAGRRRAEDGPVPGLPIGVRGHAPRPQLLLDGTVGLLRRWRAGLPCPGPLVIAGKMYESVEVGGLTPTPNPFLVVDFYNQNRSCLLPEKGLPASGPYSTPLRTPLWNGSNHCRYPPLSPIVEGGGGQVGLPLLPGMRVLSLPFTFPCFSC